MHKHFFEHRAFESLEYAGIHTSARKHQATHSVQVGAGILVHEN